jgi:hypothetical protein
MHDFSSLARSQSRSLGWFEMPLGTYPSEFLIVHGKDAVKKLESKMSNYTWEYGSSEAGLRFTVVYDDQAKTFTVNVLEGHMDLNALWFSDGDSRSEGNTKLSKSDNSLNMNGATQVWEDSSADSEKIT